MGASCCTDERRPTTGDRLSDTFNIASEHSMTVMEKINTLRRTRQVSCGDHCEGQEDRTSPSRNDSHFNLALNDTPNDTPIVSPRPPEVVANPVGRKSLSNWYNASDGEVHHSSPFKSPQEQARILIENRVRHRQSFLKPIYAGTEGVQAFDIAKHDTTPCRLVENGPDMQATGCRPRRISLSKWWAADGTHTDGNAISPRILDVPSPTRCHSST